MKTAEDIVHDKQSEIVTIEWDKTVLEAIRTMIEHKIGAIVVQKHGDLVGVWSERDLLNNITNASFDVSVAKVGDYMNHPLKTASFDTPITKLEEMFLGLFIRHLVIEKDGHYIGFISIGDVLRANLLEKDQRFKQINTLVSWDYYEDWKWGRKKRKR